MRRTSSAAAALLLACLATPLYGQQPTFSAGASVRFITGSFGTDQTTHLVYSPAMIRMDAGRFEVAGYFPFVSFETGTVAPSEGGFVPMRGTMASSPSTGMTPGRNLTGGMGGMMGGHQSQPAAAPPVASPGVVHSREAGFGDVVASVGYRVIDRVSDGLQVTVTGRAKLPTAASSRGLGTGKADYGLTTVARKRFADAWLYGEVGYIALGDPDGLDLRNAVLWSVGGGRRLTGRLYGLVSAAGNSAILPEFGTPAEIGAGLGMRISDQFSITLIPSIGLSDASPAFGLTAGVSTSLRR